MKNKRLNISTLNKSYPIIIGSNIFKNFEKNIAPYINNNRIFILTDKNINKIFKKDLVKIKKDKKLSIEIIIIGTGEKQKDIKNINSICNTLLKKNISRDDTIIALGGGVVGDITGFVSSIILRGVNYIQIPTTLLSQVDSSVGGKTGINSEYGKNLIGSFYQPSLVLIDINFLTKLNNREMKAGYAEIIKYSLIFDIEFFNWLIINGKRVMDKNKEALTHAIFQSCQCKSKIVSLDEKEKNIRALLNFGHTFGHVIEQTNSYKTNINHGEAVAMGMIMASKLSSAMNLISINELNKIINHFKLLNLPTQIPRTLRKNLSIKRFIDVMNKDKKTKNNKINLILLKKIGKAYQTNKFDSHLLKIIIKDSIT